MEWLFWMILAIFCVFVGAVLGGSVAIGQPRSSKSLRDARPYRVLSVASDPNFYYCVVKRCDGKVLCIEVPTYLIAVLNTAPVVGSIIEINDGRLRIYDCKTVDVLV